MNISYNWLKEYISFDLSPRQLAVILTSIGLEVESIKKIELIKGGLEGLIVGKILSCKHHPNSSNLYITDVSIGNNERIQVVCGSSNVKVDQNVIIATCGTVLYSQKKPFSVKKSKIRGVESYGMICSESEIGLGPNQKEIIVVPKSVSVGTFVKDFYHIQNDFILEINITPNRIDAASHYGVARDLAVYLSFHSSPIRVKHIELLSFKSEETFPSITVKLKDYFACLRYTGLTIKNVEVKESPQWLKKRLESVGVNSINNIVDATNYVMYEYGQPIHAFDLSKIEGNQIIVKCLPKGTQFVTLDKKKITLSGQDLMICDKVKGLCIGGVLGGLDAEVTTLTKDLFLESACFNPTYIRRTTRLHGIATEASFRFERGTDPNCTVKILKRVAILIQQIAGGVVCGDIQDCYYTKINPLLITINIQNIINLIGKTINEKDIEIIINSLGIIILDKKNNEWIIKVPTYRGDVTREVDIIEEILRIYGYDKIETTQEIYSTLPCCTITDQSHELKNILSEQLTGAGFNEIINNSLTSSSYYKDLISFQEKNSIFLQNPLSLDLNCMRQTLLFGGLETISYNSNHKQKNLQLYEFGNTYFHVLNHPYNNANGFDSLFEETTCLALWMTGYSTIGNWVRSSEKFSFFELKAFVENILYSLKIYDINIVYNIINNNDIYSTGLSIQTTDGKVLGSLGILQKSINQMFGIKNDVYFSEINWSTLIKESVCLPTKYVNITKYPLVRRDLSLLVENFILFADIKKISYQADKKILKEIILFDVYEGNSIPIGKKSYTVSYILQDKHGTLCEKQIDYTMNKVLNKLKKELNVTLRGH